ncbi:MAG TPA: DUF378 domain-containing protein [Candidatus Paceibacterota bacterium]|nr:DUF378 domain-containing protein [Candidatus Paceibacterota bacterium]
MKALHCVAFVLVMIGALNWGLIGTGGWNVVDMLLNSVPMVERILNILVGVSALVLIFTHKRDCKMCMAGGMDSMSVSPKM